jgi:predicted transglutaminase-like cysteine proteinase
MNKALGWRADLRANLFNGSRAGAILPAALFTLLALFIATAQAQTVASLPTRSKPLAAQGPAEPTAAWVEFCIGMPLECAVDAGESAKLVLTPETWATLNRVNREVNRAIKPLTDRDHWGVVDRWDFAEDGYGDCEDYQLVKRRQLVELGLPRRALRMTVVLDEEDAGHAVLMVLTNRGDFVLDNKRDAVVAWSDTSYTFVKREGHDSAAWVSLEWEASPVETAKQ